MTKIFSLATLCSGDRSGKLWLTDNQFYSGDVTMVHAEKCRATVHDDELAFLSMGQKTTPHGFTTSEPDTMSASCAFEHKSLLQTDL